MFEQLRQYRSIAWDFDDTLVNHPRSQLFWDFIKTNPFDQTHHIVTMRSHGMEEMIFPTLENFGSDLTREHFSEVIWLQDHIWSEMALKEKRFILLTEDEPYFNFKGETCKQIGAEVLIDDMEGTNVSAIGCRRHGVPYLHPNDLIPD